MLDDSAVLDLEEQLRRAMLASDVNVLGALVADDLVFTTQTGEVVGKEADLDAHRSGLLRLSVLDPSERRVVTAGDTAVVSVRMQVAGTYGGEPVSGAYRYTRVWGRTAAGWQILGGHVSEVQDS